MFGKDIGIDLGTANTLVFMKGKGIIMREPSVVAVDTRNYTVKYVGQEAKDVIGRTPGSIVAVRPLKDGVIADFDITASMLQIFIKKACNNSIFARPRVVICIPSGVTAVERRAVKEASLKAGARHVAIIEEPMAAAIGAGLPVAEATGSMVVDIGGGTSEVAVISLGGIVASRSVRVGGDEFDSAIIQYVKKKYNLLIGDRTAENIKIQIGSAYPYEDEQPMEIKGRNLVDGLPKNMMLHPEEVREALMLCIMGASYILNLFSYDEFYHWEKYLRVLPVSTKQVVLSRYATFGIMASATAVISLVYLLVLNTPMQEILSVLLMTVVLNVYFAAVMIPVAYKWGVQKGRLIFMLVLGVSSGLFVAGVFILNRQVSVVATASFYKMVLLGIAGLFLLLVLGLLLSIHLSVKIVSKKEL